MCGGPASTGYCVIVVRGFSTLAGWHVPGQPLPTASLAPAGLAGIPATGPVVVADSLAEASLLLLKLWPQQWRWQQRRLAATTG